MSDSTSQYLRIIPSEHLNDRFLTAQRIISEDTKKKNMGEVFVIVEITRPWLGISQIGSRIINTFRKAYYDGDSSSDLVNFEKAVKTVNEMLLKLTEQGETDWIGRLNAVIGIMIDREVHITSAGLAQAYLFRDGKISHITEKQDNNEPHPLKTFGSIISGTLLVDDIVFMTSSELINTISLTILKTCFEEATILGVGTQILKHIKRTKVKSVGAIIIKLTDKALINPDSPEVLYTDKTFKANSDAFKQLWVKTILPALIVVQNKIIFWSKQAHLAAKNKVIPATSQLTKKAIDKTSTSVKGAWSKTKPTLDQQSKKFAASFDAALTGIKETKDTSHFNDNTAESIIGKSIFTINDYQETAKKNDASRFTKVMFKIQAQINLVWKNIKKTFTTLMKTKNRPILFTLIGVLLIMGLIISISIQKHNKNLQASTSQQKNTLSQASDKLSAGQIALSNSNKDQAQVDFGDALKLAQPLLDTPLQKQAQYIVETSQNEFDKLTGTTRYKSLKPLADSQGDNIQIINNKSYEVSNNGRIYETGLIANAKNVLVGKLPSNDNTITSTVSSTNDTLLITTNKKTLYEYNPQNKNLNQITSNVGLENSIAQATFVGNDYLLDNAGSQIWKYNLGDQSIQSKTGYISDGTNLKEAVDLAIDGSVYVLFKDGHIGQFIKGRQQAFTLASIPKPFDKINGAISIYTDQDSNSIYILDKSDQRIIEFDKNGQFTHQYFLPSNFKHIQSFAVQPKSQVA
jgi:hypothetical protein